MDMQAGTHAGTGETGWEPKARRGRPRDPLMEVRLLDAALEVYGQNGWLGFNLDAVARRAKVSKDALYRRWRTREALLADALRRRWDWVGGIDSGTIRGDLTELAERAFDMFAGSYGEVALQLRADARRFDEVRTFEEPYRERAISEGRSIVRRAIARGDLPETTKPGVIMDLLVGAVINHVASTPVRLREEVLAKSGEFVRQIVEVVLIGSGGQAR